MPKKPEKVVVKNVPLIVNIFIFSNEDIQSYMFLRTLFFLFTLLFSISEGTQKKPSSISEQVWNDVEPYLLPEDHPIKLELDSIFSVNCIANGVELYKAGFRCYNHSNPKKVTVGKHPKLKGYIVKLFLDNQPVDIEWPHWIKRIEGARLIGKMIEEKAYTASFKVPRKWIYCIPCKNETPSGRHFILIAEDMEIVSIAENLSQWKNQATYEEIYMFWDLLATCGLFDSVYIDNISYCKDGMYAFVDTEHYLHWPVDYKKFNKFLKKGRLKYWKALTNQE